MASLEVAEIRCHHGTSGSIKATDIAYRTVKMFHEFLVTALMQI